MLPRWFFQGRDWCFVLTNMNNYKNNRNLSKKRTGLSRLIAPGAIILLVIILGIVIIFLQQNHSNNSKRAVTAATTTAATTVATTAVTTAAATAGSSTTINNTTPTAPAKKIAQQPAFDITKRLNPPPIDNEGDYLKWMLLNTPEKNDYLTLKWKMEQAIIANKDATSPRVIEAFLRAPREFFFPNNPPASSAYANAAIPIGFGQTISGPHLVARMTQAIDPQPGQKVLEIGTGSGYQSSVLAELSNYVYTIEIVPQLAQRADAVYTRLLKDYPEYANIKRENADGYYGWVEYAPFDRIIVTAGIDHIPPDLLKQLAPNGIMVIPVGPPSGQTVLKITKEVLPDGSINFKREDIYQGRKVIFVPFTSKTGIHSEATN
ncbi:MAG: protein-L-isoaspartate O-methyltransferase family protein [Candidatus Humimicrobiaceae bacterium]